MYLKNVSSVKNIFIQYYKADVVFPIFFENGLIHYTYRYFVLHDTETTKFFCQLHHSCYESSSIITTIILGLWHLQMVLVPLGCSPEGSAFSCRPEFTSSARQHHPRAHGRGLYQVPQTIDTSKNRSWVHTSDVIAYTT